MGSNCSQRDHFAITRSICIMNRFSNGIAAHFFLQPGPCLATAAVGWLLARETSRTVRTREPTRPWKNVRRNTRASPSRGSTRRDQVILDWHHLSRTVPTYSFLAALMGCYPVSGTLPGLRGRPMRPRSECNFGPGGNGPVKACMCTTDLCNGVEYDIHTQRANLLFRERQRPPRIDDGRLPPRPLPSPTIPAAATTAIAAKDGKSARKSLRVSFSSLDCATAARFPSFTSHFFSADSGSWEDKAGRRKRSGGGRRLQRDGLRRRMVAREIAVEPRAQTTERR